MPCQNFDVEIILLTFLSEEKHRFLNSYNGAVTQESQNKEFKTSDGSWPHVLPVWAIKRNFTTPDWDRLVLVARYRG